MDSWPCSVVAELCPRCLPSVGTCPVYPVNIMRHQSGVVSCYTAKGGNDLGWAWPHQERPLKVQVSVADLPGRSQGQVPIGLEEAVTMLWITVRLKEALGQHGLRKWGFSHAPQGNKFHSEWAWNRSLSHIWGPQSIQRLCCSLWRPQAETEHTTHRLLICRNCEFMNLCCLSHSVCDHLLHSNKKNVYS